MKKAQTYSAVICLLAAMAVSTGCKFELPWEKKPEPPPPPVYVPPPTPPSPQRYNPEPERRTPPTRRTPPETRRTPPSTRRPPPSAPVHQGLHPVFSVDPGLTKIWINPNSVSASSSGESGKIVYYPANVVDGRRDTCWAENRSDRGEGEWLYFNFDGMASLGQIGVIPGYDKYQSDRYGDRFVLNPRVRTAELELSDGSTFTLYFMDDRRMQYFTLPLVNAEWARLVILETRPGTGSHDTSISEVEFWMR